MSDLILRHSAKVIGLLVVGTVALTGLTLWVIWDGLDQEEQLAGVERAGPCRSLGIENSECQRQARLLARACALQPTDLSCSLIVNRPVREGLGEVVDGGGNNPSGQPGPGQGPTTTPESPERPTPISDVLEIPCDAFGVCLTTP